MNRLSKEEQLLAVKKVLEEMEYAQKFLTSWNLGWWEQLSDAYCLPIYEEVDRSDVLDMEKKYKPRYNLTNTCINGKGIGVPLCTETITGNNSLSGENDIDYLVDFGEINWDGINTKNSERKIIFSNDEDIRFFKNGTNNYSKKHPRSISYNTHFNVLREWIKVNISISSLLPVNDKVFNTDRITILANTTCIVLKYNNIQIIYDLVTNKKIIKTEKYDSVNNKAISTSYELKLNQNGDVEIGNVIINDKTSSGNVIGTYHFDASYIRGVRATYYSKSGKAFNLAENKELLNDAKCLLPSMVQSSDPSTILINDLVNQIEGSINKQTTDSINFVNNNLDMTSINLVERKIVDALKNIKGELPLKGLLERIDNYLELLEKLNPNLVPNNSKKRELNLNKKLV